MTAPKLTFNNALDLLKHHTEFPSHTYSLGLDYGNINGSLTFETVAEQFRRRYGFEFKLSLDYGDKNFTKRV